MNDLFKKMNDLELNDKVEDNLYVKNIIVNKDKTTKKEMKYVATEKWINQLCNRLLS